MEGPYRADVMLGVRRRGRLLDPRPRHGLDLQEPTAQRRSHGSQDASGDAEFSYTAPEDGAEEAAGVVRPEAGARGGVGAAADGGGGGGAPAGAAGALLIIGSGIGGAGAEGRGLVDLRLSERQRQQRPRRVTLRGRQRGRHGFGGCARAPVARRQLSSWGKFRWCGGRGSPGDTRGEEA